LILLALVQAPAALSAQPVPSIAIPASGRPSITRRITVDDISSIREVDSISLSPDRRRFSIFVRQGDWAENRYRTAWFIGDVASGKLIFAGDGGELGPEMSRERDTVGEVRGWRAQWSPDGQWIVYQRGVGGEIQLWRSSIDGRIQERVAESDADILDFTWNVAGTALLLETARPRTDLQHRREALSRDGYQYDRDIRSFLDFAKVEMPAPQGATRLQVVSLAGRAISAGNEADRRDFNEMKRKMAAGTAAAGGWLQDDADVPIISKMGEQARIIRRAAFSRDLYLEAKLPGKASESCTDQACHGAIRRIWWSKDGKRIHFWRGEGINARANGFYSWDPAKNAIRLIARFRDDDLRDCQAADAEEVVCAGETATKPPHLVLIDLNSGKLRVLSDLNPEFRYIRLGRVERLEWDTPHFSWNALGGALEGLYPKSAYGFILYPPDYDPKKKYPVFISPYVANGFTPRQGEQPLQAYAANDMIVLNSEFPNPNDIGAKLGAGAMRRTYDPALGWPHLTMLMESTVAALDTMARRGLIDETRVGIGGVSHGTFIPLYLLQKRNRLTAMSISAGSWGPEEYYWPTRAGREAMGIEFGKLGYDDWRVSPRGAGAEFWRQIDIAEHVDDIEAPILMHHAASEAYSAIRFMRTLEDSGHPYDAYVYPRETHFKWQPAHLHAIMTRNLDWFRFWLEDIEDTAPSKTDQYQRWRLLRDLQCKNPMSRRSFCAVISKRIPVAH
jgi:dipeptidyl aminopeptidase/acylaminoacyl peptidase